ncbi:hypothetical protein MMC08_001948 [Hypocenomyce scalaris]|nr:hypothetical protein [Hypocenomyce scalaris]
MEPLVGGRDFPLPQVVEALAPYIKTRQEALRIRRTLSIYLTSHLRSADGEVMNDIILSAPGSTVQVLKVPTELSGLRKDYLRALQANIKARNEYKELTRDSTEAKSNATPCVRPTYSRDVEDRPERVSTYLSLLQERRRHEKLSILQDYLEMLNKKDVATSDYLSIERMQKELPPAPEAPLVVSSSISSDRDTESLLHRLEKTVLRAKHALETEEKLLFELKNQQQTEAKNGEDAPPWPEPGSRVTALCKTRDELIKWIEEQLAKSSQSNEDTPLKDSDQKMEEEDAHMEQRKAAIAAKYEHYLEARKAMIGAASEAVLNQVQETKEHQNVKPQIESEQEHDYQQATWILPHLTEYLIPSARAQKTSQQQESHIAASLSTQQKLTAQLLDRLANESHLLPNYPLLARQPRFKNSAAALGIKPPSTPLHRNPGARVESRSIYEARAWTFAADAARSATHETVEGRLEHGSQHARNAEGVLDKLGTLLGSGGNNGGGEGEGTDSDEWTKSGTTKSMRQTTKANSAAQRRPEGIWRGIDGKVGLPGASSVLSR